MKRYLTVRTITWAAALAGIIALISIGAPARPARAAATGRQINANGAIPPGTIPGIILFNAQAATDARPTVGPMTLVGAVESIGGNGVALKVHADSGSTGYVLAKSTGSAGVGSHVHATGTVSNGVLWANSVTVQDGIANAQSGAAATLSGKVLSIAPYSGNLTVRADSGATGVVLAQFAVHAPIGSRVAIGGTVDRGVMFAGSISILPVRPY